MFAAIRERLAAFSPPVEEERRRLKDFLYENLYYSPALAAEKEDAERITGELFAHWMEEPDDLPRNYREKAAAGAAAARHLRLHCRDDRPVHLSAV